MTCQNHLSGARPREQPRMYRRASLVLALALGAGSVPARAQQDHATLRGGVPAGEATSDELALSLTDAIDRGLRHNLAAILGEAAVSAAEDERQQALADLLPQIRAAVAASRLKINLAAYGFSMPGTPAIVGPFNVFDARGYLHQTVLDFKALNRSRAASSSLEAARQDERNVRDLVVLACGQLYLQAVAGESRIASTRAQLATAEALLTLARDRKASGLGAGIDVLRAQVQVEAQQQRLIVAEQETAREKLNLARAIGLPLGQRYHLVDSMPAAAAVSLTVEEATRRAWEERPDLKAARARVEAAEAAVKAAQGERLPSLAVSADFGAIGNDVPDSRATFTLGAALEIPVFQGGRISARVGEAQARLATARARLEDQRAGVYYEVQTVFLDLKASADRVEVAQATLGLAREQLEQARDRFKAGVADNLEVVQAQQTLAAAEESHISSLYALNVARLSLVYAVGGAEASYTHILKGH
jgi:outer membrane protein TolC